MDKGRFRIAVAGLTALALLALWSPHNRADIRILTHEQGDRNPHEMRAAIDIGLVAISVLITWTQKLTR
ncbi:hypothetical protein OF829_01485 [Sphingomonas sp. LB-2]|uniref:hypothetical protein n=1 Tax=Sphingomonas caeni TaxID=2984949 RepID=UPI00222F6DBC|nr:hypothetical protein [Sphingomonas caeni]MCW3845895.1 hypothetical protein [Sphingomonas caeni]